MIYLPFFSSPRSDFQIKKWGITPPVNIILETFYQVPKGLKISKVYHGYTMSDAIKLFQEYLNDGFK